MMIGFVGLGLMGAGFTKRLIATGHAVTGYDPDAARLDAAVRLGVSAAASAAEVAQAADIILVCVINTAAVEDATLGPRGIAAGDIAGKVVVDHSTTEIKATLRIAEQLARARRGVRRCAGVGRARRCGERHARHHGGRRGGRDRAHRARDGASRADDAHGRRRRRPGDQAGQPDHRADELLRARRGAAARRSLRRGRRQDPAGARARATPARTCCRSRFPAWRRATSRRAAMRARC